MGKRFPLQISIALRLSIFKLKSCRCCQNSCLACHNRTKAKAGAALETPADILKGGDSGPAVVAGKSTQSLVLKAASHDPSVDSPMPPPDNKVNAPPLTSAQLGVIKLWIDQGRAGRSA